MSVPIVSVGSVGDTRDPYIYGDTIHGVFARHAARHPEAPALIHGDQVVSYGDLATASDLWAAIFTSRGIGPGCFVVVRMRRSAQFAAALMAILKLGAAYLAAERLWPQDYVQDLLDRADAWLITDDPDFVLASPRGMLVVDAAAPLLRGASVPSPVISVSRDAPCTIFQTSGSTGSPKLAVVPHRATVRAFIGAGYADFGVGRVIMQASPVCWDGLTMELWSVLLSGGTSLIPPEGIPVSGDLLRSCSAEYGLDTVWLTSSLFNALVDDDIGAFSGIRQVMSGGERVSPDHVRRLLSAYPGIRFSSGYGPVETTVFATSHTVSEADLDLYGEVPLGRPLPATEVLVLDEAGDPCPPGTVGEIHIGGDALGLGYVGDPAEIQPRYVTSPHGLLYRTGDLGEWHESGVLLFRGRVDRQLKIRGQRVEPEQLERYISQALPGVVVAVTPLRDSFEQVIGLVAHCGVGVRAIDLAEIKKTCEAGLPPYMRPRRIVVYPELPRNDNGKINYQALESAVATQDRPEIAVTRPRSGSAQGLIVQIASDLLGTAVGSGDDFFQLGGDSLFAMRLASRLWREEGIRVPVGQIHQQRTAMGLTRIAVRSPGGAQESAAGAIRAVSSGEKDLCIHEKIYPGDPSLLVLSAYELHGGIDDEALRAAIALTCTRYPALSTIRILESETIRMEGLTADQVNRQLQIHAEDETLAEHDGTVVFPVTWLSAFDLARDMPLRAYITGTHRERRQLGFVIHHAAMDGWSEHIFTEDLSRAYDEVTISGERRERKLPTSASVQSQVAGQAERERAGDYWRGLLDGVKPLPVPKSQPWQSSFAESRIALTRAQCRALAALPGRHADLHSGALAWYADALKHAFSRMTFIIGSTYAARDLADEKAIGYYAQMIPVLVRYPAGKSIFEVASDISEQWVASLDQRSLSLHEIAACVRRSRVPGYRSVFQAGFSLQRIPPANLRLAGYEQRRLQVRPPAPPFEIYLEIWPSQDGEAVACLQWDDGSVPSEVARQMAERLSKTISTLD